MSGFEITVELVGTPSPSGDHGDEPRRVKGEFASDDEPTPDELLAGVALVMRTNGWAVRASGDDANPIREIHVEVRP